MKKLFTIADAVINAAYHVTPILLAIDLLGLALWLCGAVIYRNTFPMWLTGTGVYTATITTITIVILTVVSLVCDVIANRKN